MEYKKGRDIPTSKPVGAPTSLPELAELRGAGNVQDVGSRKNALQQVNGILGFGFKV